MHDQIGLYVFTDLKYKLVSENDGGFKISSACMHKPAYAKTCKNSPEGVYSGL